MPFDLIACEKSGDNIRIWVALLKKGKCLAQPVHFLGQNHGIIIGITVFIKVSDKIHYTVRVLIIKKRTVEKRANEAGLFASGCIIDDGVVNTAQRRVGREFSADKTLEDLGLLAVLFKKSKGLGV